MNVFFFLMINFQDPKLNPYMYTELAQEILGRGHNVYVIALLERKSGLETSYKKEYGLNVLRLKCGDMFNVSLLAKGITTVSVPYMFRRAIKRYFGGVKFDLVIYPTPPITLCQTVRFLKKRDGCGTYLILRDIFPQNGVDLGIIRSKLLYLYFRLKEKKLYGISDHIGCMSERNVEYIALHNKIDKNKLELLYNWAKLSDDESGPDRICYRRKYALENKIIALFGGNIGPAQEMGFLLSLIELYRDRDDIVFLIVGDGTEKETVLRTIEEKRLTNAIMKDRLPSREFDRLARECDIGLINLDRRFTIPNIPSKVLSYFKASIPVLASVDRSTDFGRLLDDAGAGLWSITGDLESYRQNFETLVSNAGLRREMGLNGRRFLQMELTVEKACDIIMDHFTDGGNAK